MSSPSPWSFGRVRWPGDALSTEALSIPETKRPKPVPSGNRSGTGRTTLPPVEGVMFASLVPHELLTHPLLVLSVSSQNGPDTLQSGAIGFVAAEDGLRRRHIDVATDRHYQSLPRDPVVPNPQVRYDWTRQGHLHSSVEHITVPEKVLASLGTHVWLSHAFTIYKLGPSGIPTTSAIARAAFAKLRAESKVKGHANGVCITRLTPCGILKRSEYEQREVRTDLMGLDQEES